MQTRVLTFVLITILAVVWPAVTHAATKVVFVAGPGSHGYGAHEFRAGCLLLAGELKRSGLDLDVVVSEYGWPREKSVLDDADAVVMMCTGDVDHLLKEHADDFNKLSEERVGLVCIHTATIAPKGEVGDHFLKWIGGYHEFYWSVVAHWEARFETLPQHPITRGVKPFTFNDEWYFHMRFRPALKGVTPILSAHPPRDKVMKMKESRLGTNPAVKAAIARGAIQHVAWAFDRDDGGRGFGFTGAHSHWSWADPNYRKLVLNAILWTARAEVPSNGVATEPLTLNQLLDNQDDNPRVGMTLDDVRKLIAVPLANDHAKPRFEARTILKWNPSHKGKRLAFLAGNRSGEYGTLESYAGSVLLGQELQRAFPQLDVAVFAPPFSRQVYEELEKADAVVFCTDRDRANPLSKGARPVKELLARRPGTVVMTGSLVALPGQGQFLLDTTGVRGTAGQAVFKSRRLAFKNFPDHPVSRGLKPFEVEDGWLTPLEVDRSHTTITPILVDGKDGTPLLWVSEKKNAQRTIGFAGGYHHFSLGNRMYRKALLNAIAWAAGMVIPENGVNTEALSLAALKKNQNHRPLGNKDWQDVIRRFGLGNN